MTKTKETELLKTPIFTVVKKEFKETDFTPVGLNCPDWVMVIALDKQNRTLIVKQTRWGKEGQTFEFPCGTVEKDEEPVVAAKREFEEETGIEVALEDLELIGEFNPNPAQNNNLMRIYFLRLGDVLDEYSKRGNQKLDENEDCVPMVSKLDSTLIEELMKNGMSASAIAALAIHHYIKL